MVVETQVHEDLKELIFWIGTMPRSVAYSSDRDAASGAKSRHFVFHVERRRWGNQLLEASFTISCEVK